MSTQRIIRDLHLLRDLLVLFQYDQIAETLATDLLSKQTASDRMNNVDGNCDNANQLRTTFITHRPSQIHTKKARDSVLYKVKPDENLSN